MSRLGQAIDELKANEQQWNAFGTRGHCVVLAPPGSGKTKLLATKLAYELASGAIPPPQGAACITLTNEAADELRRRLRQLGTRLGPNVFVGTVHSFALGAVVAPYARAVGRTELAESRLASDHETSAAFDRALAEVPVFGHPFDVRSDMNKARRLGDYSGSSELGGTDTAMLARRYEEILEEGRLFDFNDLMRHAVSMIRDHQWVRRMLVATYPHLYVDEYQDLPPSLDELIRALCFDEAVNSTLFAVGDPDQAIYGFIGTRPELLRELANRRDVTEVTLELNYRCGQDIVEASLLALGISRAVRGVDEGGDIIIEAGADGPLAARERAVQLVKAAADEGVSHEQIIVLTQGNDERDALVDDLRAAEIPVFARSDKYYGATHLTMTVEAMALYAASDPAPAEVLGDLLDSWQTAVPEFLDHAQLTKIVRELQVARADALARDFVEAMVPLGLRSLADDPGASQDGRQLERMRRALATNGELSGLSVAGLGDRARAQGRVMAATTHGAKGLEFDVVIMCDCEEGRLPHWGSINSGSVGAIDEDRRKFYVSLTRARRRVHLVWSRWRISRAGNQYPIELSRFARALIP